VKHIWAAFRVALNFILHIMPYLTDLYYQSYHPDDLGRKPLVLIHGAGGEHLAWPSEIRRLANYRVYTPDLPGHGKSKGHGLQRISAYGEHIQGWIHELELPKFFLVGHSMGGAIALWFALQHPSLIHGLVLISTGAQLPVNLSLIEDLASPHSYSSAVDDICKWSFSPGADPRTVQSVKKQMLKTRSTVFGADFRACDAFDLSDELGKVQTPTLVLVGENDRMTPLRFSEELRDGIKGSTLEVVKGAGHMLPLEKPGDTALIMRRFFRSVLEG
jgi:pimeloyl-ACP methyl ester carboxylesterase